MRVHPVSALTEAIQAGKRRISKTSTSRILIIDIERTKGRAEVEFWDLGEFKNRRLHPKTVVEWPRTICFAYRWYGEKRIGFHAEWDEGGADAMFQKAWELYDRADIVVGHNIDGFDTKKLNGEWWPRGLPKPRPFKSIDTLKVARQQLGFESNTLDAILTRAGLTGKTDTYSLDVAQAALAGDKAAQRKLAAYNRGDIEATQILYDAFRGWIPNHPHMGRHGDVPSCNQCDSESLTLQPNEVQAAVLFFPLYRCDDCGANVAGRWHSSRAAVTKGVR